MDWQEAVALGIVALTTALVVGVQVRARFRGAKTIGETGCSGGCPGRSGADRPPQMTYRSRQGERPRIIIRSSRPS